MKQYVLGFQFTENKSGVWLIRKNKPENQKGKLNGIGGKVEDGESPFDAMVREYREEAGLDIFDWKKFCVFSDSATYEVYCYFVHCDLVPQTRTDEKLYWSWVTPLPNNVMYNIHWLIPMALNYNDVVFNVIEEPV